MKYRKLRGLLSLILGSVLVSLLIRSGGVFATPPTVPPISRESLVGVWEAVNPGWPELIRLDLRKNGWSYVGLAIQGPEPTEAAVFQVKELRVNGGRVDLTADDLTKDSNYSIIIEGKGQAGGGWGRVDATTTLRDRGTGRSIRRFDSVLVLTKRGYVRDLLRLSEAAEQKIHVTEQIADKGRDGHH